MFSQNENSNESLRVILLENQRLLIENNQMLHTMRRASRLAFIFRILWALLLIGAFSYAYTQYIKPNMEMVQGKLDQLEEVTGQVDVDTSELKSLYRSFLERLKQEGKRLDINDQTI